MTATGPHFHLNLRPDTVSLPHPEPVLLPSLTLPSCADEAERAWYGQAGVFGSEEGSRRVEDDLLEFSLEGLQCVQDFEEEPRSEEPLSGSEVHHSRSLPVSASWSVVSHPEILAEPSSHDQIKGLADLVTHTGARVVDPIAHLKLPWEQGLYKPIFDADPLTMSLSVPPLHTQAGSESRGADVRPAQAVRPQPVARSFQAFKQHLDVSYEDRVAKLAEVSIGKLVALVDALPRSCRPVSWPAVYEECVAYLQACVGVKSPLTIEKRANSLLQYLRWASREGVCSNIFSEEIFWSYVQRLKHSRAPVSRGPAVASALRFASHVLGIGEQRLVLSRRCLGLLEQMEASKGPLKQASPFTVGDLLVFHGVLKDHAKAVWDRAAAAYLLVCAYGRARAGDFSRVASVSSDLEGKEGFLEILLKTHKGAKKARLKRQLVPVLIPSIGVDGSSWVPDAISAFASVGLSLDGPLPLLLKEFLGRGK